MLQTYNDSYQDSYVGSNDSIPYRTGGDSSWDASVGKTSAINSGSRPGGSFSVGGGMNTGGSGAIPAYQSYVPTTPPAYTSSYITPDKNKIRSMGMMGGGNALKSSISDIINKTISSSASLPFAVRRAATRNAATAIGSAYSTAMPQIMNAATSQWNTLYGTPQSRDIEQRNQYDYNTWLATEKNRATDWQAQNAYQAKYGVSPVQGNYSPSTPIYSKYLPGALQV